MNASSKATSLKKLHAWYKAHGRHHLPWRTTEDAYHIYISEIMLQQTQVKTVLERFYFPFLETFPTLDALAAAPEEKVMKAWQGLGYYNRAKNLHRAAKKIVSDAGLENPSSPQPATRHSMRELVNKRGNMEEYLLSLPGIGKNTAHAILAFAFRKPVPVMEANVKRVLSRLFALKTPSENILWEKAEGLLDKKNPFDFNQAMMDIGAMVCAPKSPNCGQCPLAAICAGKESPELFPQKKGAKKTPLRKRTILVWQDESQRYYVARREGKFLGGLYGFPQFSREESITLRGKRVNTRLMPLGKVSHTYSHFRLEGNVMLGRVVSLGSDGRTLKEIRQLPLSRADEKVLALL